MEPREIGRAAYSIMEFCHAYGLGRSTFYRMQAAGLAPRTLAIGRRRIVTKEAATDWCHRLEAASPEKK
jgi:predicted DNA-binding transcriptional regulator AlpA